MRSLAVLFGTIFLCSASSLRDKRQVLILPNREDENDTRWPDKTVHFYMDKRKFDFRARETVIRGMEKIEENTCVNFMDSDFNEEILIKMTTLPSGACRSAIGRQVPDQPFYFSTQCPVGTAVHELTHALGFVHAHQRLDRDLYINIDMAKYQGAFEQEQYGIFKRQKTLVPYDYGSIMQYYGKPEEFTSKDPEYQNTMGSEVVAYYDYLMINMFYDCFCPAASVSCKNYGYPNPRNCSKCNCPLGYGGVDCAQRPEPGASLEATENWTPLNVTLDAGNQTEQIDFVYHYLWITAPNNKTIEINIENFSGVPFKEGCPLGGFEVKTREDPRLTSPRQCHSDSRKIYRSENNPLIVMFFNREGLDEYQLSYRYVEKDRF